MEHPLKKKKSTFKLYRYQILPTSQDIQLDLEHPSIKSLEDLKKQKNEFFKETLFDARPLYYSRTETVKNVRDLGDKIYILKLGAKRSLTRTTKDFREEEIETWPSSIIIINNDPSIQKIAIQENKAVASNTSIIAKKILGENLNKLLVQFQLNVILEEIVEKKVFWDIVKQYENKIIEVDFELISPNLANISRGLRLDLGLLNKTTNTQKTDLNLKSDTCLTLSQDNKEISSLVDYTSEGGGNIKLKLKNVKKKVKTSDYVKSVAIDEIDMEGDPKTLKVFIEELFK